MKRPFAEEEGGTARSNDYQIGAIPQEEQCRLLALNGPTKPVSPCPLFGVDQK
jgi:hypothetical protein